MALIRATCSECGDVELQSLAVKVRICAETNEGTYYFRCPVCRMTTVKSADNQIIDILACAGVKCVEWHLPAELGERPSGPPITDDDLIDFHELLQGVALTSDLIALGRSPGHSRVKPPDEVHVTAPTEWAESLYGLWRAHRDVEQVSVDWGVLLHRLYPFPPACTDVDPI